MFKHSVTINSGEYTILLIAGNNLKTVIKKNRWPLYIMIECCYKIHKILINTNFILQIYKAYLKHILPPIIQNFNKINCIILYYNS